MASYSVTIGGVAQTILEASLDIELAIGRRSTCSFSVVDTAGTQHFSQGAQILLYDGNGVLVFGGFVSKVKEKKPGYAPGLIHTITGMDYHYCADKRLVAAGYLGVATDFIVNDLIATYLASEGVTVNSGQNLLSVNQSSVETDATGFIAKPSGVLLARDTTTAYSGVASMNVVTDGTGSGQGVFASVLASTLAASTTYTVSCYIKGVAGASINISLYQDTPNSTLGTFVTTVMTGNWQRITQTAATPGTLPGGNIGIFIRTNGTLATTFNVDSLQMEAASGATFWKLGSSHSVASGSTVNALTFNYQSAAACFDQLAKLDSYWWAIDQNKMLWYQPYTGVAAPWTFDGTQGSYDNLGVDRGNTEYRNRQWVVGGKTTTSSQTNSFKGDGVARSFTCGYQLAQVPTITVNGVSKTVGIKGVDVGKDWYWAKDDAIVLQDNAGTLLTTSDTLAVTYVGEYPIIAVSANTALITAEAALEGGGTGYVESKYESATISGTTAAFQIANALISHYGQATTTLTFSTLTAGLQPGQLLTVNLAAHGLNTTMLIENIKIADHDGVNIWYDVTALAGPYDINWQTFWANLLAKSQIQIDQSNQGTPQIVAILDSEALTWTWTLTGTQTVFACPVPSSTLFPSATLFPC